MTSPELSVVLPAYNEGVGLARMFEGLHAVLLQSGCSFEVVVVDDGSTDDTAAVASELASRFPQARLLALSRNFGKEAALAAGMEAARGRAVVFIDADLQHPPGLIARMIEAWREGAQVVNAVKRDRGSEPMLYRVGAGVFNRALSRLIDARMVGASDYKLIDRVVVDALLACPERARFFRGLVAWVGFEQVQVLYDVQPRQTGRSSWSLLRLIRYSLRNLLVFTSMPLYWVAAMGFFMAVFSFVMLLQTVYRYAFSSAAVGFTTVISLQGIIGGMILFALGVIAAYLALMYEELKFRPLFFVRAPATAGQEAPAPGSPPPDRMTRGAGDPRRGKGG